MVTKPSAAEIAERHMPGWKAIEPSGPIKTFGAAPSTLAASDARQPAESTVDAVMPSTKQLRRKFYGDDAADAPVDTMSDGPGPDIEIVDMKSGDLERTVGVNTRTQKIEWSAG